MHVVVVGGGFGGIKTALELSIRQIGKITLISDESYFLHHATLYATATGKSIEESVIPLNVIFAHHPNVEIVTDTVTAFDPHRKLISSKKKDYHYDKLVLSLGSVTTYFGIKGLQQHAYGIKTLDEIRKFHDHIHDEVVSKKLDQEYFVVGGGPTGVELASALNEYLNTLKFLYRLQNSQSRVTLVEATFRILPHMSETASRKVTKQLEKQGIKVLLNHKVNALSETHITIEDKVYSTNTAVWTSGVSNNPFFEANAEFFHLASNGRVNVNPYLEALDDVYVIGDSNTVKFSGMAWPAFRQAKHVAHNIVRTATKRPQKKYRPSIVPYSVPVGDKWGYVEWFGTYISGRSGFVVRRWIELYGYCQLLPFSKAVPIWRAHDLQEIDTTLD
ncbi:MAG: FAD-dependent oxidoreductase [Candidatus Microsaccharimonas sp.]